MTDTVSKETRSRMMSGIRGKDTKPELLIRKALHAQGFRFRLHRRDLPGRPDIVLAKHRAVIQIHGCFWHGHDCKFFKYPSSNPKFWKEKIETNRARDAATTKKLIADGWRCLIVWECATRSVTIHELTAKIASWILSGSVSLEVESDHESHTGRSTENIQGRRRDKNPSQAAGRER